MKDYSHNVTTWPEAKVRERRSSFYAIDVEGVTVATADLATSAVDIARHYAGQEVEVRFVQLGEADYVAAEEAAKKEFWATALYRPTPSRRTR